MQSETPQKVFVEHPALLKVHHKAGVLQGAHISYITRTNPLPLHLERAILDGYERYVFEYTEDMKAHKLDLPSIFSARFSTPTFRPIVIEIGFGDGDNSFQITSKNRGVNYLCFDVYLHGLAEFIERLNGHPLDNVLLVRYDAEDFITHSLALESVDGFNIFFPDPWHKKKHQKRRIVNPNFSRILASCLKKGGFIHCATDHQQYAQEMHSVLSSTPGLYNPYSGFVNAPQGIDRFTTTFEKKAAKEGRESVDIIYKKR